MPENLRVPSAAAQAAHEAFHEAWGGLGQSLDLYVTSPIWERIAEAVLTAAALAPPPSKSPRRRHMAERIPGVDALQRCNETHGGEHNKATVYGHHASVRYCIRLHDSDVWVYDPRWETAQ